MQITRSEWREKMLQPNLQLKWDKPDELYSMIISALNDGFAADLLPAAERLLAIDTIPERSHTIHGIVLMKNGQLDAAEATLREGMRIRESLGNDRHDLFKTEGLEVSNLLFKLVPSSFAFVSVR